MFKWLFGEKGPGKDQFFRQKVLNSGLELAMQWGKEWGQPIQKRLGNLYPSLPEAELRRINTIAYAAVDRGIKLVYELAEKNGGHLQQQEWEHYYLLIYSWVSKKNLESLFSQGMYYMYKDGGLPL